MWHMQANANDIYIPVGIRFSYLENAILGILRAEMAGNILFHIKYNLIDIWPRGNPSVAV